LRQCGNNIKELGGKEVWLQVDGKKTAMQSAYTCIIPYKLEIYDEGTCKM